VFRPLQDVLSLAPRLVEQQNVQEAFGKSPSDLVLPVRSGRVPYGPFPSYPILPFPSAPFNFNPFPSAAADPLLSNSLLSIPFLYCRF
jgi:hypothetical protein